jgi:hypothetical protein
MRPSRCSMSRMALCRPSPFDVQVVQCNDQRGERGAHMRNLSASAGQFWPARSYHIPGCDGGGDPNNNVLHYAGALAAFRTDTEADFRIAARLCERHESVYQFLCCGWGMFGHLVR